MIDIHFLSGSKEKVQNTTNIKTCQHIHHCFLKGFVFERNTERKTTPHMKGWKHHRRTNIRARGCGGCSTGYDMTWQRSWTQSSYNYLDYTCMISSQSILEHMHPFVWVLLAYFWTFLNQILSCHFVYLYCLMLACFKIIGTVLGFVLCNCVY